MVADRESENVFYDAINGFWNAVKDDTPETARKLYGVAASINPVSSVAKRHLRTAESFLIGWAQNRECLGTRNTLYGGNRANGF